MLSKIMLLLGCLFWGSVEALKAAEPLDIAIDQANPPFMYEVNQAPAGLYPLILREVFGKMGVPILITPLPWKRALEFADNGQTGIVGISKNESRLQKYDYSAEIFKEIEVVYVLEDKAFDYQSVKDFRGKTIGVLRGWYYGDDFEQAKKLQEFVAEDSPGDEQNFRKLLLGRIDALITIEETARAILNSPEFQAQQGKLRKLEKIFLVNPTYLIFPKQSQRQATLSAFDETLAALRQSGDYQRLIDQYFAQTKVPAAP